MNFYKLNHVLCSKDELLKNAFLCDSFNGDYSFLKTEPHTPADFSPSRYQWCVEVFYGSASPAPENSVWKVTPKIGRFELQLPLDTRCR